MDSPHLTLVVDDDHPWFDALFSNARAQRNPAPNTNPPEPPQMTVTVAGVSHTYHLEHIAEVAWVRGRARVTMRTVWQPTGEPTTTTTTTEGDTKK